jgi:hypothetical protein
MKVETSQVLREPSRIATTNIMDVFDADGNLLQPKDLPEEVARAVASINCRRSQDRQGGEVMSFHVRLWSKTRALKMLSQCLGLY